MNLPRTAIFLVRAGLLAVLAAGGAAPQPAARWQPIGLSGGGAMFAPAISPADPKLIMVNCDMSAAYLSRDGGATWRMINHQQLESSTRCQPAFHPTDPQVIFAASGWSGLRVSRDQGEHWEPLGNLRGALHGQIAIDPGGPERMMVGIESQGVGLSLDGGRTWKMCDGPRGAAVGFHFDQTSPAQRRVCLAATTEGVWRSDDGGAHWTEKSAGLPWRGLRSFAGGSNAKTGAVILYTAIPSKDEAGQYAGGVYRSTNRGDSWESAMGTGANVDLKAADRWAHEPVAQYHWVLTTNGKPATVYALNSNTGVLPPHHTAVYRSDDAGKNWRPTFYPDPRFKDCNLEPDYGIVNDGQYYQGVASGAAIAPSDADCVLQVDNGNCQITRDGGKTWVSSHARPAPGQAKLGPQTNWQCSGLVVTTTWNYYIDPFEPQRHYICYTDIGFARSLDAGRTWRWWPLKGRAPWRNTCYELAFDPQTPGKIWGAFSNVHDIPNANIIEGRHNANGPGGVCVSTDFGDTWAVAGKGLPLGPCTSVVVDAKSPKGRRTLYAGVFGQGVFKSSDDGQTWESKNQGLGAAANMRVCKVQLHADGTLFALVTALRAGGKFQAEGVGLYRSRDGGGQWEKVNGTQPLLWPKDFTVDARDSRVIYLGAADAGGNKEGGLYRTTDGGATWVRLLRKENEHFGAYLHPKHAGWIYATLCEGARGPGLWLSKDNGATWTAFADLPFANITRVTFDPADETVIYVTTFGGSVWRGPSSP